MTTTYFVGTTHAYRRWANKLVTKQDYVLELGCAFGDTTQILAKRAKQVLACDKSTAMIEQVTLRCKDFSNLEIQELDARAVFVLKDQGLDFDIVFIDVGGDAAISRVTSILHETRALFTNLRAVVVRSYELAAALGQVSYVEELTDRYLNRYLYATSPLKLFYQYASSPDKNDRLFAAKMLVYIQAPVGEQLKEFKLTVKRLQEDPTLKVRYFARQYVVEEC